MATISIAFVDSKVTPSVVVCADGLIRISAGNHLLTLSFEEAERLAGKLLDAVCMPPNGSHQEIS
jgi:hypothetical protein